ncbi:MAG: Y-family DNA polymerase [Planctomycetaceae bacterium]
MSRILTLWLPRFAVQRRLLAEPSLRSAPVIVVRRQPRGVMTVVCWAWAEPPAASREEGRGHRAAGAIEPGMPLAEAMAVLVMLHGKRAGERAWIDHDDPEADRAALLELARWCRRFTPAVAVEPCLPGGAVESLCLDVTATAAFFGGEERLARTAIWMLAARGLHARGAIADTIGASWAAARHVELAAGELAAGELAAGELAAGELAAEAGAPVARGAPVGAPRRRRHVVVPPGGHERLAALPAAALRLDGDTLERLREVGVDTVGGVARLPRRSLASRFGPLLVRRLAEWTGQRPEPLDVAGDDRLPHAGRTFDFPLSLRGATEETIVGCVAELVAECVRPLAAAGRGVTAFQVRFERPAGVAPPVVVDVGLFRPSIAVRHLVELVRLRLARTRLPAEIEGLAVEVVVAGPVVSRQRSLFAADEAPAESQVEQLLDRLSGRLGRGAVFEPRAVADAQPEHAWLAVPPCLQGGRPQIPPRHGDWRRPEDPGAASFDPRGPRRARDAWRDNHAAAQRRPLQLLPRPARLETARPEPARPEVGAAPRAPVPAWLRLPVPPGGAADVRRRQVVCAQGPERIETAWWRGPCVRRDYFLVECVAEGADGGGEVGAGGVERWWIFRRLRDGAWFLHGLFA